MSILILASCCIPVPYVSTVQLYMYVTDTAQIPLLLLVGDVETSKLMTFILAPPPSFSI